MTDQPQAQPEHKPLAPLLDWIDSSAALFGFQKQHTARTYVLKTREEVLIETLADGIPIICEMMDHERAGTLTKDVRRALASRMDRRYFILHGLPLPNL